MRCAEGLGSHGRCPGLRGTTRPAAEPCDSQPCELVRGRPGVAGDPPPPAPQPDALTSGRSEARTEGSKAPPAQTRHLGL